MSRTLPAVRGMRVISPADSPAWARFERLASVLMQACDYHRIHLPLLESTALFKRSVGEVSDIVEKEMYSFADRNGDSLSLRPEGTAGCVRAYLSEGLSRSVHKRLWYLGPMFRRERPQKGRYRQFTQLGVEVFGLHGSAIEAELLAMCQRFWQQLGVTGLRLELNTLGSNDDRKRYAKLLFDHLKPRSAELAEEDRQRLERNPLRVLDSKSPATRACLNDVPDLHQCLSDSARQQFSELCGLLDTLGVAYQINPRLVRGLDYYSGTVFEWVTDELGAQGTVCAGGRYDRLVPQLGGPETAAVGFAMGVDRILALLSATPVPKPDLFLIALGEDNVASMLRLAERCRDHWPALCTSFCAEGGSLKSQLKRAAKRQARLVLMMGDDERQQGRVSVRQLQLHDAPQHSLALDDLDTTLPPLLADG